MSCFALEGVMASQPEDQRYALGQGCHGIRDEGKQLLRAGEGA